MTYLFSKNFWLDLIFPIFCLGCKKENRHMQPSKQWAGGFLCKKCFTKLKFYKNNKIEKLNHIDQIFIAGDYNDSLLADLIKTFKFKSITKLAEPLTDFLIIFWQGQFFLQQINLKDQKIDHNFWVIPIPLSSKRTRQRGFNQSELIARIFSQAFNYQLNLNLKKIRNTKPQSNLNGIKRLNNVKNVFSWQGGDLTNRNIILIDDVITTGATINEAAKTLRSAGAKIIIALALAKG